MNPFTPITAAVAATVHTLGVRLDELRTRRERGDVPGWVMITLMTAGLVAALTIVAKPALTDMFNRAMSMVTG